MKLKNNLLIGVVFSLVVVLFSAKAMAVPSYGLAVTSGSTYYGPYDSYLDYFADGFVSGGGSEHGFGFDIDSGSVSLTVFTNQLATEAWLMAESNFSDNLGAEFGPNPFIAGKIAGYTNYNTYLALSLGTVSDDSGATINAGWSEILDPSFHPAPYYKKTVEVTFVSDLTSDDLFHYFFAAGNVDGVNGLLDPVEISGKITGGEFSPKTTSSQVVEQPVPEPVPEPATVALLGLGLVGLAGAEVRRRRKKKAVENS